MKRRMTIILAALLGIAAVVLIVGGLFLHRGADTVRELTAEAAQADSASPVTLAAAIATGFTPGAVTTQQSDTHESPAGQEQTQYSSGIIDQFTRTASAYNPQVWRRRVSRNPHAQALLRELNLTHSQKQAIISRSPAYMLEAQSIVSSSEGSRRISALNTLINEAMTELLTARQQATVRTYIQNHEQELLSALRTVSTGS